MDCEDSFEALGHNTTDLIGSLNHIRDKTDGNIHKNRLDDLERKLGRLQDKILASESNNEKTGISIDEKYTEIGDKEVEDLEPDEIEKHIRDLKTIGNSIDRSEKERDRHTDEYNKLLKEYEKLRDDIVKEMNLEAQIKEDQTLNKDTDSNLK